MIIVPKTKLQVLKAAFRICLRVVCHRKKDLTALYWDDIKATVSQPLLKNSTFRALGLILSSPSGLERGGTAGRLSS